VAAARATGKRIGPLALAVERILWMKTVMVFVIMKVHTRAKATLITVPRREILWTKIGMGNVTT